MLAFSQKRGAEGGETRSGTQKRPSHNLQSGQPAWWSAGSCSIFPTVNQSRTQEGVINLGLGTRADIGE